MHRHVWTARCWQGGLAMAMSDPDVVVMVLGRLMGNLPNRQMFYTRSVQWLK